MVRGAGTTNFVAYLRVSTERQGRSGLGLDAQKKAVAAYLARLPDARLICEFVETESGKSELNRPKLLEALNRAAGTGAKLIIAKLDRLSRDVNFLSGLAKSGVEFVACDMPDANEFTVTIMAALAQQERKMISERTKAALQIVKEQEAIGPRFSKDGVRKKPMGNAKWQAHLHTAENKVKATSASRKVRTARASAKAEKIRADMQTILSSGEKSLGAIAAKLESLEYKTPRGGTRWHPETVRRLLQRLGMAA